MALQHLLNVVSMEMTCSQKCTLLCAYEKYIFLIKLAPLCMGMSFSLAMCPSLLKKAVFFFFYLTLILLNAPLKEIRSQRTFHRSCFVGYYCNWKATLISATSHTMCLPPDKKTSFDALKVLNLNSFSCRICYSTLCQKCTAII